MAMRFIVAVFALAASANGYQERLENDYVFKVQTANPGHRLSGWAKIQPGNTKCKMARPEIRTFGYCWMDENEQKGINTQKYRAWVREAIRQWEACGDIRFVEESKCRVGPDFVTLRVGTYHPMVEPNVDVAKCKINGFDMYLSFYTFGNVVASKLNWTEKAHKAEIQQYALHEFGHFLGFDHEQNRNDFTPGKCPYKKDDPAQSEGNYAISDKYDLDSIMNYCRPNVHYKPWLSEQDKRSMWQTYGGRDWNACEAATKHWTWNKGDAGEGYDDVIKQLQIEESMGLNACADLLDDGGCDNPDCNTDVVKTYYCPKKCGYCG